MRPFSCIFYLWWWGYLLGAGALSSHAQVLDSLDQPVDTLSEAPLVVADSSFLLAADSLQADSLKKGWLFNGADYPNPRKALLYSLIIPGAGQLYNKKWYKVPFVYGGLFGLGFWIHNSTNNYLFYERAYRRKLRDLPHDLSGTAEDNLNTLRSFRDRFDKSRQTAYIIFVVGYALGGVEAFVDAHLAEFDVSDDLTLQVKPSIESTLFNRPAVGIGLAFSFQP